MTNKQPNIVWLILDSLRPDHMSCYGYSRQTTPNIDRIAEQGTLFTQAISPGTGSPTVHTSWLTGRYPSEHGIWGGPRFAVSPNLTLLSQFLFEAGYVTAGFSENLHFGSRYRLTQGFSHFVELPDIPQTTSMNLVVRSLNKAARTLGWGRKDHGKIYQGQWLTKTIEKWLDQVNTNQPFFVMCNFMETHVPHNPPWPFLKRFVRERNPGWHERQQRLNRIATDTTEFIAGVADMTDADMDFLLDLYDAEIAFVDSCVGHLVGFLEDRKLLDETLLIITADHADYYGEHGLIMHNAFLYDTLIRVPLILRLPGHFENGTIYDGQVNTLGLSRTVLDLACQEPQETGKQHFRGESLIDFQTKEDVSPVVFSEGKSERNFLERILAHNPLYEGPRSFVFKRALRTPRFKYMWDSQGEHQFFDLLADPGESNNLINVTHPRLTQLQDLMTEVVAGLDEVNPCEKSIDVDEEAVIQERLRELGYLEL